MTISPLPPPQVLVIGAGIGAGIGGLTTAGVTAGALRVANDIQHTSEALNYD